MYGYRHAGQEKPETEMEDIHDFAEWLECFKTNAADCVRFWYVDDKIGYDELLKDLVDGKYIGKTKEDWLIDALDLLKDMYADNEYDWKTETVFGVYWRE